MKYIVFGTGNYCSKYLSYIDSDKIICFVDNDERKIGGEIKGKTICSVKSILKADYDYIIVLVRDCTAIVEQLLQLKVSPEKIIPYNKLYDIVPIQQRLIAKNNECSVSQWIEKRGGRKVFICCHDFSRSGVPVASMNLALLLKKMNFQVLVAAVGNGTLEEELRENNIDFISDIEGLYASERFMEQLKGFDIIILGTIAIVEVGRSLSKLNLPILWWIHESDEKFYKNIVLPKNRGNIHYYGGGKRVLERFHHCFPSELMKELLYFLPDIQITSHDFSGQRIFAIIGMVCKRKAQDILISAIKELSDDVRKKCVFYFIGVSENENKKMIENACQEFEQIRYVYEMNQKDLAEFYQKVNVLVCPSRDDPMPIVVTQALQNGIPCIVSSQVGQCEYINAIGGGSVFPSEDAIALKQQINKYALCSTEELEKCSKNAELIFDLYFSEKLMRNNVENIFSELL